MAKKTNLSNIEKPKQTKMHAMPKQAKKRTVPMPKKKPTGIEKPKQTKLHAMPKQAKKRTVRMPRKKPTSTGWFKVVNDDKHRLTIPVGPRFQADVPEWIEPLVNRVYGDSKWLGTKIWPTQDRCLKSKESTIGQGRPDFCSCASPRSIGCMKRHMLDKKIKLLSDLGLAYWRWKFDEMGEEILKVWNSREEKEFESIMKMNPNSSGESFMKPALERLRSQNTKTIVSYYFNVYIPRRVSNSTRSGLVVVDTDDEVDDDDRETHKLKTYPKNCQPNKITSSNCTSSKTRYLKGRR